MTQNPINGQELNEQILSWLDQNDDPVLAAEPKLEPFLRGLIKAHPEQRFGQIVAKYLCPDYNDGVPTRFTRTVLKAWFSGVAGDIAHEESKKTFTRLTKNS